MGKGALSNSFLGDLLDFGSQVLQGKEKTRQVQIAASAVSQSAASEAAATRAAAADRNDLIIKAAVIGGLFIIGWRAFKAAK